jgi:cell division protein FtsB
MTAKSIQSVTLSPMRPSRKPRLILIFLIALCGLFVYSYTMRLVEKSRVESEIVAVRARIAEAKDEQYELLEMRDSLNEPDYIDRVARELFGLAKPGDTVLTMIKEQESSPDAADVAISAAASPADLRNLPIWQQWVVFFTTEQFALSVP